MERNNSKQNDRSYLENIDIDLSELGSGNIMGTDRRVLRQPGLFLGNYSKESLQEFIEESGLKAGLAKRGYKKFNLDWEVDNLLDQRLHLIDPKTKKDLVFMRIHVGSFHSKVPGVPTDQLDLIFVDWLLLQNPSIKTDCNDKLFPGQVHPGLGLFREVKNFITSIAEDLKLDGAANLPEFFHDAVLFADRFQFLHPESEGLFRALRRQLRPLGLKNLSLKVQNGEIAVKLPVDVRKPYKFEPGEMVSSNCQALDRYFASEKYLKAVDYYYKKTEFSVLEKGDPLLVAD